MTAEDRAAHVEREAVGVAALRVLVAHVHCWPATFGAGPDWCSGCDWRGDGHAGHVAEMVADAVLAALPQTGDAAAVLLAEVIRDSRIRHDHDYPMEFGPHHCDGCDLEDRIRAALTAGADQ